MTILNSGCAGSWPWGTLWTVAKQWYNRDKSGDDGAAPEGSIPSNDDKSQEEPSWTDDLKEFAGDAKDAVKEMLETGPGMVVEGAGGDLIDPDMSLEDALGKSIFDLANKSPVANAFKNGLMGDFTDALGDILPSDTTVKGGLQMGYGDGGMAVDLMLIGRKTFNVWSPEVPGVHSQVCTTISTSMFVKLGHDLYGDTGTNVGGGVAATIDFTDFNVLADTWGEDLGVTVEAAYDPVSGETTATFGVSFLTGS